MKLTPLGSLILVLAVSPAAWGQTDETPATDSPSPAITTTTEDAQTKALRDQLERETAARKAEADAAIAADIAKNPDGANAVAARKAEADKKTAEAAKQTAEERARVDADSATKAAAAQDEKDRKAAAAAWAAGAAERARVAAAKQAAIDKWRATAKPAPSIIMGHRGDTFTVMVDGKISKFATEAEAQAYADKVRTDSDPAISY